MAQRETGLPDPASQTPVPRRTPAAAPIAGRIGGAPIPGGRGGIPPRPPGLAGGPDIGLLLKALQRRWLLAFGLGLMAALLLGAAGWVLLSPKFTAITSVRVAAQSPSAFASSGDTRNEFNVYLKSTASQIKGRKIIDAALNRDEVRRLNLNRRFPDPAAWLDDELKVEFQPENEWISVKLSMDDPDDARTILNALTASYLKEVVEKEERDRSGNVAYLERIYTQANNDLTDKIKKSKKDDIADPELAKFNLGQLSFQLTSARNQHAQVALLLVNAKGKRNALKAQEKTVTAMAIPETDFTEAEDADATIKQAKVRLQLLKDAMKRIKENSDNPSREPAYIQASNRVREVEKTIEERRKELRPELEKKWRQKLKTDFDFQINKLDGEIVGLSGQESNLKLEAENLSKDIQKLNFGTRADEALRAEIERAGALVKNIDGRLQPARFDLAVRPRVTVPSEAALMARDIKKQLFGGALGAIAGLFGVCFGVAWLEFRRRRVQSPDEVTTGLGLRVVGAVPASADVEQIINAPPEEQLEGHAVLESVDAIRTLLVHDAHFDATRVLMVTSAESGEGKSTLASHLASSLSRAGRKTLLVDGDLRQPALHQLFEVSLQPGFSEVLLGEVDSVDAILPTNQDGLLVMPAGQWDREVIQSLARGEAAGVLEKLKEEFDFVVVDSHPLLAASDSLLLGQHVDAVILSLLRDVSQTPRVYAATQRLQSLGIRVLGAVVNGTDPDELFVAPVTYVASAA